MCVYVSICFCIAKTIETATLEMIDVSQCNPARFYDSPVNAVEPSGYEAARYKII